MKKTVEEINKMIMEDAPMEEINDAIGYIDICSCFDPMFEPPIDFLEECRKRREAAQSSDVYKRQVCLVAKIMPTHAPNEFLLRRCCPQTMPTED